MTSGFLKEADVDRYFGVLARARAKAGKDTVYDPRVAEIETEMQPLKKLFSNMKRTGPTFEGGITHQTPNIDGDLEKPFWRGEREQYVPWYPMVDLVTGQGPDKNRTSVSFRLTGDRKNLVIGVVCHEGKMSQLRAKTTGRDDFGIFSDDVVEVYIETPERSFFKIVVNSNGAVWDETQDVTLVTRDTLPELWNPGVRAAVRKEAKRWTVEILIPTKDFGTLGPTKDYPWGINVGRARLAGGSPEAYALSPTGVMRFLELSKLGNLVVR
jgi:hypothetical protein